MGVGGEREERLSAHTAKKTMETHKRAGGVGSGLGLAWEAGLLVTIPGLFFSYFSWDLHCP